MKYLQLVIVLLISAQSAVAKAPKTVILPITSEGIDEDLTAFDEYIRSMIVNSQKFEVHFLEKGEYKKLRSNLKDCSSNRCQNFVLYRNQIDILIWTKVKKIDNVLIFKSNIKLRGYSIRTFQDTLIASEDLADLLITKVYKNISKVLNVTQSESPTIASQSNVGWLKIYKRNTRDKVYINNKLLPNKNEKIITLKKSIGLYTIKLLHDKQINTEIVEIYPNYTSEVFNPSRIREQKKNTILHDKLKKTLIFINVQGENFTLFKFGLHANLGIEFKRRHLFSLTFNFKYRHTDIFDSSKNGFSKFSGYGIDYGFIIFRKDFIKYNLSLGMALLHE